MTITINEHAHGDEPPPTGLAQSSKEAGLIAAARSELKRINFGEDDTDAMICILRMFFDQWDSGGAVWAVAPILQKLIAGKPLSPLTGEDDEWLDPLGNDEFLQNVRCGTVFKTLQDLPHRGLKAGDAYDLEATMTEDGHLVPIKFPYNP